MCVVNFSVRDVSSAKTTIKPLTVSALQNLGCPTWTCTRFHSSRSRHWVRVVDKFVESHNFRFLFWHSNHAVICLSFQANANSDRKGAYCDNLPEVFWLFCRKHLSILSDTIRIPFFAFELGHCAYPYWNYRALGSLACVASSNFPIRLWNFWKCRWFDVG